MNPILRALATKYRDVVKPMEPYVSEILDSRIVEQGENANGWYVIYSGGWALCGRDGVVDLGTDVHQEFDYPVDFSAVPVGGLGWDIEAQGGAFLSERLDAITSTPNPVFTFSRWRIRFRRFLLEDTSVRVYLFAFGRVSL